MATMENEQPVLHDVNRDVWAEVNLGCIEHNLREIRRLIRPEAKLCAVVKANAYGHGAVPVARVAQRVGADYLAVATVPEGIELREAGFTLPVIVLGLAPEAAAPAVVKYNLTQTVCSLAMAEALSQAAVAQNKNVKVHLKIETGMGRIGIRPAEAGIMAAAIVKLPNVGLEGMFSHFAEADCLDKSFVKEQLALFKEAIAQVEAQGISIPLKHIAESAAILEIPEAHFDMARAGVIEYGMWPSEEVSHECPLQPAMKLKAKIAFIKDIVPGESIGYGRTFKAKRPSRIATLPIGYADGYIRAYGRAHGQVEICGKLAPIAGRICMDQVMIDITDIPEAKVGDTAVLFGSELVTVDDAARWLDTINYEITCLVSARVPRVYLD